MALDQMLIKLCRPALDSGEAVRASLKIRNVNRTVGTILGHEVTKATKGAGLPDGTIDLTFEGSAGQSFGAFLPAGITLRLEGDSNDYLAKGLSGGRIVAATGAQCAVRRGGEHHRGQRDRLRRDLGRDLHPGQGGGALLRPQLRRHRGRRGPR